MTATEKNRIKILVVLLIVAGLVWFLVYRPGNTRTAEGADKNRAAPARDVKAGQDAQIRLDLLDNIAANNVGRKNLFQYRQKPLPPQPPPTTSVLPSTQIPMPPQNPLPLTPREPAAPAFKAFRYEGFSVDTKSGRILASLSESGNTYTVKEGECLMGQYCVRRLTESLVEVEDVLLKRRQTVTRTQ